MAEFDVKNVLGKKITKITLDDSIFMIKPNEQAIFDLLLLERAQLRQGTHSTKNRSEVSGGGRKPWRQKGTGRARQGSIRSPQWRGGGVVFGPQANKNYHLKINKKVKKLAFKSGWSQLVKQNRILIIDNLSFKTPSTKDFLFLLKNLEIVNKRILLILDDLDSKKNNTYLSARNIKNISISTPRNLFLNDLLAAKYVLFTSEMAKTIEENNR